MISGNKIVNAQKGTAWKTGAQVEVEINNINEFKAFL